MTVLTRIPFILLTIVCWNVSAQSFIPAPLDTSSLRFKYLRKIALDTSLNSYLIRLEYIVDSTKEYRVGFLPNRKLYQLGGKSSNPNYLTTDYLDAIIFRLSFPPTFTKKEIELYPIALITSRFVPNEKVKQSIKTFIEYYFDNNGWLKQEYWKYWTQIADYLYENNVLVKFRQSELPLQIEFEDLFKWNKRAKKKLTKEWQRPEYLELKKRLTRVLPIVGLDVGAIGFISLSTLVPAEGNLLNTRINF